MINSWARQGPQGRPMRLEECSPHQSKGSPGVSWVPLRLRRSEGGSSVGKKKRKRNRENYPKEWALPHMGPGPSWALAHHGRWTIMGLVPKNKKRFVVPRFKIFSFAGTT